MPIVTYQVKIQSLSGLLDELKKERLRKVQVIHFFHQSLGESM